MGDLSTLAKARKELEEMYLGIPDDSINLTFQDLAVATQNATDKKKSNSKELNPEVIKTSKEGTPLHRIPSLAFSQALKASNNHNHNHHNHHLDHVQRDSGDLYSVHHHHSLGVESQSHHHHGHRNHVNPNGHSGFGHAVEGSIAYDDASVMSRASMYPERAGRRRPGIPHSNICTICSNYVYILRNWCLVRVSNLKNFYIYKLHITVSMGSFSHTHIKAIQLCW